MDLLERMPVVHQEMFRRMLRSDTIPQGLVEEYFHLRTIADRADINICHTFMAQIAMKYAPMVGKGPAEGEAAMRTLAPSAKPAPPPAPTVKSAPETASEETPEKEKPAETAPEPVHEAPIELPEQELAQAEFVEGQAVEVWHENSILEGTIIGQTEDGKWKINVEGNPEPVIAETKDIEAS